MLSPIDEQTNAKKKLVSGIYQKSYKVLTIRTTMEYKECAIELAYKAGAIMKEYFSLSMKKEYKEDNTSITEADLKINQLVIDTIKKRFPKHNILAEEGSPPKQKSDYTWVCDPIDGTLPFSHGMPTCAFSLALVERGTPILGVVYDPFLERLFTAEKGKGAFVNGKKIRVSLDKTLEKNLIGMSIGVSARFFNSLNAAGDFSKEKAKIISLFGVVYPGVLLASGQFIAVIAKESPWDVAAIKILVEEAGGKVTDLHGNDQRYDREIQGCVLTNGKVHNRILEIIKRHETLKN